MKYIAVHYNNTIQGFITNEDQKSFLEDNHPDVKFFSFDWEDELHPPMPHQCDIKNGKLIISE